MTATEELRRLLDERGVEWDKGESPNEARTYWRDFFARPWDKQRLYVAALLTPEQAIAATLGPGTCHMQRFESGTNMTRYGWSCSECGMRVIGFGAPKFCPNCGRKVGI